MSLLTVKNISKRYLGQERPAVKGASFHLDAGEFIVLAGESGSGKSTLLRTIAGLEQPDEGSIHLESRILNDSGTFVAPEKRDIGLVFQDYALFPHLTVGQNIAFGLKRFNTHCKVDRVQEMLQLVALEEYKDRYPHQLSGGQQQRTALARALAPAPRLILLDEPFSNLDASLKEQVRLEIQRILQITQTPAIFVTHDIQDALATADRILIMREGLIQQIGSPQELYEQPVNDYVARFFGKVNLVKGKLNGAYFHCPFGKWPLPAQKELKGMLMIRPENLSFSQLEDNAEGIEGTIREIMFLGGHSEILVEIEDKQILVIKSTKTQGFTKGELVKLKVKKNCGSVV